MTSAGEALLWLRSRRWVFLIGPASIALVLATGIYLMVAEWGADAWILVSLVSLVALGSIGGVLTGIADGANHASGRAGLRTASGGASA